MVIDIIHPRIYGLGQRHIDRMFYYMALGWGIVPHGHFSEPDQLFPPGLRFPGHEVVYMCVQMLNKSLACTFDTPPLGTTTSSLLYFT